MQLQKEVESESIREAIDDVAEREVEAEENYSYQGNTDDEIKEKMKKLRKQYRDFRISM